MKVCQIVPVYPPEKGGMGAVAHAYTEVLKEHGHEVTVVAASSPWAVFRFGNAAMIPSLLWRVREFDVIHVHYPFYGAAEFAALGAWLFRIPLVVTYHMEATGSGLLGAFFAAHRALLREVMLKSARAVLVSSKEYAQESRIDTRMVEELPFWIDAPEVLKAGGHKGDALEIVFIGGMDRPHYFKGVDVLLRAVAQLNSRGVTDWKLKLVGEGELKGDFKQLAKQLGIAEQCEFLGAVSDSEKWSLLAKSDVHILPSTTKAEAFGLVTVEAMTAGVPSIVSDLPGVRTLVQDGVSGYVMPVGNSRYLADRLESFIKQPELLASMKLAAKARAAQFSRPELSKRLMNIYQRVTVKSL